MRIPITWIPARCHHWQRTIVTAGLSCRVRRRQPRWHAEIEIRRAYEAADREATIAAVKRELGPEEPGRVAVDLAEIDARPAEATATDSLLAVVGRDGAPAAPLSESLARLPAYSLVARRYVRADSGTEAAAPPPTFRRSRRGRRSGSAFMRYAAPLAFSV